MEILLGSYRSLIVDMKSFIRLFATIDRGLNSLWLILTMFMFVSLQVRPSDSGHFSHRTERETNINIVVNLYFKPGQALKVKNRFFRCIM